MCVSNRIADICGGTSKRPANRLVAFGTIFAATLAVIDDILKCYCEVNSS